MIDIRRQRQMAGESSRQSKRVLRIVTRAALLMAIAALAVLKGYPVYAWVGLIVAVAWAASLPWMLRGMSRLLTGANLPDWQRVTLLWLLAIIVIAAFAVTVRFMLIP